MPKAKFVAMVIRALWHPIRVGQPPLVGGAIAKTIKFFRHGGFQVDTDG
jgi:hypothetical protein